MGEEVELEEVEEVAKILSKISPREIVRDFLRSNTSIWAIDFSALGSNPQSTVNGMRSFIFYHGLPVKIWQRRTVVYLERTISSSKLEHVKAVSENG